MCLTKNINHFAGLNHAETLVAWVQKFTAYTATVPPIAWSTNEPTFSSGCPSALEASPPCVATTVSASKKSCNVKNKLSSSLQEQKNQIILLFHISSCNEPVGEEFSLRLVNFFVRYLKTKSFVGFRREKNILEVVIWGFHMLLVSTHKAKTWNNPAFNFRVRYLKQNWALICIWVPLLYNLVPGMQP